MSTNGIVTSQSKTLLLIALALALAVPATAQKRPLEPKFQGQGTLKVMTYNMDVGTDYAGMQASNLADFKQAASNMVDAVRGSDPAGRAQAIARQIAITTPHLISLQEVATLSTGTAKNSLTLEFDCQQLLLDALAAEGLHYAPVVNWVTWDATVPTLTGYARNTWSEAVLARTDLDPADFSFSNVQHGNWSMRLPVALPALNNHPEYCPATLRADGSCRMYWPRGWVSADVFFRGKTFRFIAGHLDSALALFEVPQGLELLAGPANTVLPVIVAADLNCDCSNVNDAMYATCSNFSNAGFTDSWAAAHPGEFGYTKYLPLLKMRSDYVMVRGSFAIQAAVIVGDKDIDKTSAGAWPSDHAGVVVRLQTPGED